LNPAIYKRIGLVRETISQKPFDTLLVLNGENRRYLSGFTGADTQPDESAGALFINDKKLILATDSRYDVQAAAEAEGYEIIRIKAGLAGAVPDICRMLGTKRLGFETSRVSYKQYHEIAEKLTSETTGIELAPSDNIVEDIRLIKDPDEIEETKLALKIAENAFLSVMAELKPGMSEKEAAWRLEKEMRESGADALSFPSIVASGPNSALPHAIPGDRILKEGEPVLFDWGAVLHGYCSDTSRTTILGKAGGDFTNVFNIVVEAQKLAIKAIRGGISSRAVDRIARHHIETMGYKGKFGHGLGHGTGLAVHEAPALSPLKDTILRPGMLVTVEPGIYIAGWGGVRVENQVVVREDGAEVLNNLDTGPFFNLK
jgi:Xaa-Pro aminopeptidase